jgi:hypothetical protein
MPLPVPSNIFTGIRGGSGNGSRRRQRVVENFTWTIFGNGCSTPMNAPWQCYEIWNVRIDLVTPVIPSRADNGPSGSDLGISRMF